MNRKFILYILTSLSVYSCNNKSREQLKEIEYADSVAVVTVGDTTIYYEAVSQDNIPPSNTHKSTKSRINDDAFVARTESAFDLMVKASNKYDEDEIKKMIFSGDVYVFDKGTAIDILDSKFGKKKIKDSIGRTGWVSKEFVTE